jgi:hypothetical protein
MKYVLVFLLIALSSQWAEAKQKPIGLYSPGMTPSPAGVMFGPIGDTVSDQTIEEAYQKSITTGFKWILQVGYYDHPLTSATLIGERDKKKFQKLMPHIAATVFSEEWYEHFRANNFARFGFPSDTPNGIELIRIWLGIQHARLKLAMGKPVIWITTAVYWLQPVPDNTDYVAIDAYSADDEDLSFVRLRLEYAEVATDLPLIFIMRTFKTTGPKQGPNWQAFSQEPSTKIVDLAFEILKRDRYVALLPFLWESRPYADLVGLKDMPNLRDYFFEQMRLQNK